MMTMTQKKANPSEGNNDSAELCFNNWCSLPTAYGDFRMYDTGCEEIRLVTYGDLQHQGEAPLVRMHSSCIASEVFGALDCDCNDQLVAAMKRLATEGRGILFHLQQEGRGHGISAKIAAVQTMQHKSFDTYDAFQDCGLEQDVRRYDGVVTVLQQLQIKSIRLITNNPRKVSFLQQRGLTVDRVSISPRVRQENADYLRSKISKLGHQLSLEYPDMATGSIGFYHSDEVWGEFSNFSRHPVFLEGMQWPTVEHYYQAQKLSAPHDKESIRLAPSPMVAKQLSRQLTSNQYSPSDQLGWESRREEVMLRGLRAKFSQHPELARLLRNTGTRLLVERSPSDSYWGDGGDGLGANRLGQLLMQLRTELPPPPGA